MGASTIARLHSQRWAVDNIIHWIHRSWRDGLSELVRALETKSGVALLGKKAPEALY